MPAPHSHDFARWACRLSQRTNRSLAGARLTLPQDLVGSRFAAQAEEWGMAVVAPRENAGDAAPRKALPLTGFSLASAGECGDATRLSGEDAIAHAREHMPVVQKLLGKLNRTTPLRGERIATSLVLEPKTSVFLETLADLGARVGVFCEGSAVDPRVIEPLRRHGVVVEADPTWDAGTSRVHALRLLDALDPTLVVDDGASFARLMSMERPALATRVAGVAEETTSGVRAFLKMQEAGALSYPVVAVNDSRLKTCFDNSHGTGETCATTMQRILGAEWFSGRRVSLVGYGPVGRGFALRVRALGARVTVCDSDPVAALRAVFEGFPARDLRGTLAGADMVVSATGERHTIGLSALRRLREGTVVAVIGGILNEVALDEVPGFHPRPGEEISILPVPGGHRLRLLAGGDGVNYTVGGGNPIEVMDLSFAVQASAVSYLISARRRAREGGRPLPHRVVRLGAESERRIARIALAVRGDAPSALNPGAGSAWTTTRFTDTGRARK